MFPSGRSSASRPTVGAADDAVVPADRDLLDLRRDEDQELVVLAAHGLVPEQVPERGSRLTYGMRFWLSRLVEREDAADDRRAAVGHQ